MLSKDNLYQTYTNFTSRLLLSTFIRWQNLSIQIIIDICRVRTIKSIDAKSIDKFKTLKSIKINLNFILVINNIESLFFKDTSTNALGLKHWKEIKRYHIQNGSDLRGQNLFFFELVEEIHLSLYMLAKGSLN